MERLSFDQSRPQPERDTRGIGQRATFCQVRGFGKALQPRATRFQAMTKLVALLPDFNLCQNLFDGLQRLIRFGFEPG